MPSLLNSPVAHPARLAAVASRARRRYGSLCGVLGAALLVGRATGAVAQTAPQTLAPQSAATSSPQLTPGARPASAIAASLRVLLSASPPRSARALVMTAPQARAASETVPSPRADGAPIATARLSDAGATDPLIAAPRRVKVTAQTRFDATRIALAPSPVGAAPPAVRTVPIAVAPSISGTMPTVKVAPPQALPAANAVAAPKTGVGQLPSLMSAPRSKGAILPARGGMAMPSPLPARDVPATSSAPVVSQEQRLLLARLDADLTRAQRRLDRAESRLSEGQKQLGQVNTMMRSVMLDAGDDARGLHPFVRVAQRYLGTPYIWGGESARGFDCSGFIMRVMRDLGYRALPHSAAEQFNYGLPVSKALLKPGDIVFFANTYKPGISHVGIYLGRGRFIHAANSKVGTIVSSLNEPKWVEKYAGARRLLPSNA